ncbi:YcxB family protein [Oribacterium sp. P6A1]|uniref:YcxB family protein n=1 Tax=Oribacterium sp. P6A1 TaxID=1410612 RepID=UPI000566E511|nr:YcxB family protein [Oribacterium sp. P6A1]
MKKSSVYFEAETVFNDDAIRWMFQAEYYSYERLKILFRAGLGLLLLLAAFFLVKSTAVRGVLMLIGCWFMVSTDFPGRMRAEQVIESRKGQTSLVRYRFTGDAVLIDQTGMNIPYEKIDRMLVDKRCFYLFESRQNAVMVPRGIWTQEKQQRFVDFLSEKTGKEWKQSRSMLSMNLRDLLDMIRDRHVEKIS